MQKQTFLIGQTFLTVLQLNVKVLFRIERFIPDSILVIINSPILFVSLQSSLTTQNYIENVWLPLFKYLTDSFLFSTDTIFW